MGLKTYRKKRNFEKTPEPPGHIRSTDKTDTAERLYVIQKHAARRLHYDLRLEDGGVLKSWAVPKGPSLDPKAKRLAVQVEDHPVEYGAFEGTIPEGEYGGGSVLLWDRGRWIPQGDAAEGLRKGRLKFHLEGQKLQGGWNLVRLRDGNERDKPNWLLMKEQDDMAASERERNIVDERPESVLSGRRIEEIASTEGAVWHSDRHGSSPDAAPQPFPLDVSRIPGAHADSLPAKPSFELATLVGEPPVGDEWLHEIKLDGFRLQARIERQSVQLLTRTGQDWTDRFPSIAAALRQLPVKTALLDGELVALEPDGCSSFQRLQQRMSEGSNDDLVYYAFDLLHLDGYGLAAATLDDRKAALKALLDREPTETRPIVRYSDHIIGGGETVYREACRLNLEGMISKRRTSSYRAGRGRDWLKVKCLQRQEFVVGGFTDPSGSRTAFGSLLLGVYEGERLIYTGRVGTGFNERLLKSLAAKLKPLEQSRSPFANRVPGPYRDIHWVRPEIVVEVAFAEWTSDGVLRHPSFQGLREDKVAKDVGRERPENGRQAVSPPTPSSAPAASAGRPRTTPQSSRRKTEEIEISGIRLTNPDRLLYPDSGLTKRDLAVYYDTVADWILPHVVHRPLMVVRCPEGYEEECFHQKHRHDRVPDAVHFAEVMEENGTKAKHLMIDDRAGLIALVQMGVLEIHLWGARADRIDYPDRMVFDLDPDVGLAWPRVVEAAQLVKSRLEKAGLKSWVKTTGGKGLHVVVPLTGDQQWDEVKGFSQAVAEEIVRAHPNAYTSKMAKAARAGKVFIDYLRNGRGATAIAAYSTRARAGAPVSLPISWRELETIKPSEWTLTTVPARLRRLRRDPWEEMWEVRQSVSRTALHRPD